MAVKDVIQNDSINQNWNKMKYNGMTTFKDLFLVLYLFEKNKNSYFYDF